MDTHKIPISHIEILHSIIDQEIDAKRESINNLHQLLTIMDMTIAGEVRANTYINIVEQEISHLTELRDVGTIPLKNSYCKMIIDRRIGILSFEVQFSTEYGEIFEAIPKVQGRRLSEREVSQLKKELELTKKLKEKLNFIEYDNL